MLTGVRPLFVATMKHNRSFIAPWVGIVTLLSATSIMAYRWIFPDVADRQSLSMAMGTNPALDLVFGPARNLLTNDGFNSWRAGQLGMLFAALLGIMLVVRATRADEDSGNAELIASGVVSRPARLVVPLLVSLVAATAVAIVCFLGTWAFGGEVEPTALLSLTFAGSVLVWAGIAAVTAQLGADARTASSLAMGLMGIFYVMRGYFDSADYPDWTQWLTPFGWAERVGAAVDNNWWPLLIFVAAFIVLSGVAIALQQRRDFGQGFIAPRPSAPEAPKIGVFGLAWRLHRGVVITWLVAFAALGFVFGDLATSVGSVFAGNPAIASVMAAGATTEDELTFAFVRMILSIAGIIAAIAGAQIILRLHSEETAYRAEPLLAGSLRRRSLFGSHVLVAYGLTTVGLLVLGTVMGIVARNDIATWDVIRQAAATLPAVWVLNGVAVAVVGARPAVRLASWAVIVATFGITLLGPTFNFPDWALGISPLYHVPTVNAADPAWAPLVVLVGIAAVFIAIGFAGFRRRDVG